MRANLLPRRTALARIRRHPDGGRILDAVRAALKDGWTIVPGEAFVTKNVDYGPDAPAGCCCALGALRLKDGADAIDNASTVLKWDHAQGWAFAYGFDDGKRPVELDESEGGFESEFRLGKAVRRWLDGEARNG